MSKILLLSAGTRVESKNNKIAKITDDYLVNELKIDHSTIISMKVFPF